MRGCAACCSLFAPVCMRARGREESKNKTKNLKLETISQWECWRNANAALMLGRLVALFHHHHHHQVGCALSVCCAELKQGSQISTTFQLSGISNFNNNDTVTSHH
jgi:hypothetical protein